MDRKLLKPRIVDSDDDRLTDFAERNVFGTNHFSTDTDKDGLLDNQEITGWRYLHTLTTPFEPVTYTNPLNPDSDRDGLLDGEEVLILKTNPNSSDSDNDGLKDFDEVRIYNTGPLNTDTDGDGISDRREITMGINPLATDTDGDLWSDPTDPMPTNAFIPNIIFLVPILAIGLVAYRYKIRRKKSRRRRS